MPLAQWVRQALASARRREPLEGPDRKLEVMRIAVKHEFPTGDIDSMLAEIEPGYTSGQHRWPNDLLKGCYWTASGL